MISYKYLLEKFENEYDFLYEHRDAVAGYREAVGWFDEFIKTAKGRKIVQAFCAYRNDFISSDREAAAFAFAFVGMM